MSIVEQMFELQLAKERLEQATVGIKYKTPLPAYIHLVGNWGMTYEMDDVVATVGKNADTLHVPVGHIIAKKGRSVQENDNSTINFGDPLMYPYPLIYRQDKKAATIYVAPKMDIDLQNDEFIKNQNGYVCYTFEIIMNGIESEVEGIGTTYSGYEGYGSITMVYNERFLVDGKYSYGNQVRYPEMILDGVKFDHLFLKATFDPYTTEEIAAAYGIGEAPQPGNIWVLDVSLYSAKSPNLPLLDLYRVEYGTLENPISKLDMKKTKEEGGVAGANQTPLSRDKDKEGVITQIQLIMPDEIEKKQLNFDRASMGTSTMNPDRAAFFSAFTFPVSEAEKYAMPDTETQIEKYLAVHVGSLGT